VFRIPQIDKWVVVVSGTMLIEEYRKASDDKLSFSGAVEQASRQVLSTSLSVVTFPVKTIQTRYTLGVEPDDNQIFGVVRTPCQDVCSALFDSPTQYIS
jgi:hypothetical protein